MTRPAMAAFALLALASGAADARTTHAAMTETSRRLVEGYARMLYLEHRPHDAFARYFARDIVQHDPEIGDGIAGEEAFLAARQKARPDRFLPTEQFATVVDNILADGDLVAVKSHVFTHPDDRGRVFVDIWRIAHGRFAEHWSVIQPTPDAPLNDGTMWCGVGTSYAEARALGDTVAHPSCGASGDPATRAASLTTIRAYTALFGTPGGAARGVEAYVADDFVQHSPHIAAGKKALADHLAERYDHAADDKRVLQTGRILADGELVLVHRRTASPEEARGTAFADLFRVRNGKIVEHWEVVQAIPAFSVAGHAMVAGPLEPGRSQGAAPPR